MHPPICTATWRDIDYTPLSLSRRKLTNRCPRCPLCALCAPPRRPSAKECTIFSVELCSRQCAGPLLLLPRKSPIFDCFTKSTVCYSKAWTFTPFEEMFTLDFSIFTAAHTSIWQSPSKPKHFLSCINHSISPLLKKGWPQAGSYDSLSTCPVSLILVFATDPKTPFSLHFLGRCRYRRSRSRERRPEGCPWHHWPRWTRSAMTVSRSNCPGQYCCPYRECRASWQRKSFC